MITAKEARQKILENPSFEVKSELFKSVSSKIDKAVAEGRKHFSLTDAEHFALNKELLEKGYKRPQFDVVIAIAVGCDTGHSYFFEV